MSGSFWSDGKLQGGGSGSGTGLTPEQQAVLDHLSFNETTDRLETDRSFETPLNSLFLKRQHKISSGGENVYFTTESSGIDFFPLWGGIKDQTILANQDVSGLIKPFMRLHGDNLLPLEPLGLPLGSGSVDWIAAIIVPVSASAFALEFIIEENIAPEDSLEYRVFLGTDNTGIEIFTQLQTGVTHVPGDRVVFEFDHPVDRIQGQQLFGEMSKLLGDRDGPRTVVQARPSVAVPTAPYVKFLTRTFTDTLVADQQYVHKMLLGEVLSDLFKAEVEFHSDLPLASSEPGNIFRVLKRTANYFTLGMTSRFLAGYYESDGTNWVLRPNAAMPVFDAAAPRSDTWKTTNYRSITPRDIVDIFRTSIHGLNEDQDSIFMGIGALASTTTATGNTAIGTDAGGSLTVGSDNLFFGFNSGAAAISSDFNVGIGKASLFRLTTGNNNVAIGEDALAFIDVQSRNVAIGGSALKRHKEFDTVAVGYFALKENTTGAQNTALGFRTLSVNLAGGSNTALGYTALEFALASGNTAIGANAMGTGIVTGANNVAIGPNALLLNTAGESNMAIGYGAMSSNLIGSFSVAIGESALLNALGNDNVAVGFDSLKTVTTGTKNTAIGCSALVSNTSSEMTAVGYNALASNTTGVGNIAIGFESLNRNLVGSDNTAIGNGALKFNTVSLNTAIGFQALFLNSVGSFNTAVGHTALSSNSSGFHNTALGNAALKFALGQFNTALGSQALSAAIVTGDKNTAIGWEALGIGIVTGSDNVAIGAQALAASTSGQGNVAVGVEALRNATTGQTNVAVGHSALITNIIGDANVAIGDKTLAVATGSGNTVVGFEAGSSIGAGIDTVAIGNTAFRFGLASGNTAIGARAMSLGSFGGGASAGTDNTAIGRDALKNGTTAENNVAIGADSLGSMISGKANVAIGKSTLAANTNGDFNIAIGFEALMNEAGGAGTTGDDNIALGFRALNALTLGEGNISIGDSSGFGIVTGNDNIIIGRGAGFGTDVSDRLNIGNSIYANLVTGKLGIGLENPLHDIHIQRVGTSEMVVDTFGLTVGVSSVQVRRSKTDTQGLQAFVTTSDILGSYEFHGSDGTSFVKSAFILGVAEQDFDSVGVGSSMRFFTTPIASIVATERFTIGESKVLYNGVEVATLDDLVGGDGDVVGPASAVDFRIPTFDGTTGKLLRQSVVTISATGELFGMTKLTVDQVILDGSTITTKNVNANLAISPNGTGVLFIDSFTQLGSSNVALKVKKLAGTTASTEGGNTRLVHNVPLGKIIGIQALVNNATGSEKFTPGYTRDAGNEYDVRANTTEIVIINHLTNSENILGKLVTIIVTYEV